MSDLEDQTPAELDAEDATYTEKTKHRVQDIVAGFIAVLSQMHATNTESLSAAYTLATRLTKATMDVYPEAGAEIRPLRVAPPDGDCEPNAH